MSSIIPTIGRKVWFYDSHLGGATCFDMSKPFDATVIYVWGPTMVNLRVTDHAGNVTTKTSVSLRDPREGDAHGREYVATWMPYQTSVAKQQADVGATSAT